MEEQTPIQEEQINAEQQMKNDLAWLEQEQKELDESSFDGEKLPTLIMVENRVTEFEVDFSKRFEKWIEPDTGTVKKIIPVLHNGERKNLWLNTRNPLYSAIIKAGATGKTKFKVMRTGQKKQTRYTLVEE